MDFKTPSLSIWHRMVTLTNGFCTKTKSMVIPGVLWSNNEA